MKRQLSRSRRDRPEPWPPSLRNAIEGEKSLHAALAIQAVSPARDPAAAIYHAVVYDGSHHDDTAILVLQIE